MSARLRRVALVAACWLIAVAPAMPSSARALAAAAAVLLLPGRAIERAVSGTARTAADLGAPARWLTLSIGMAALAGLVTSAAGAGVGCVLVGVLAASLAASLVPMPSDRVTWQSAAPRMADERVAFIALLIVTVATTLLAAAASNVARDRMWYLAFIADIASGRRIDWAEPFLGSGELATRFAHNGWLVALAAWTRLGELPPTLVFERLTPPLLCVFAASSVWQLATRVLPAAPALAAFCSYAVLIATRYPFFSPDRYAFFARIAEDKIVALLVLVPVTLAAMLDVVACERRRDAAGWTAFALSIFAVGMTHPLVLMLLGLALAALLPLSLRSAALSPSRVVAALALAAVLAALPARIGLHARTHIVGEDDPAAAWSEDPTHPVVRAHLRMERLRDLPRLGPIVEPGLVAEPLLLLGLAGLPFAWTRRRSAGAALLVASSLVFVVLAFMPGIAPAFGRIVLPWMAYRALWIIPFGSLAALVLYATSGGEAARGTTLRVLAVLVIGAAALVALPWERLDDGGPRDNIGNDRERAALIAAIAALPDDTRISAAPGLAELLPALASRRVLAFSDRGTFVFAGDRTEAERRLAANAAIVGLAPGNPRARRRLARAHGVTHVVLDAVGCGRLGAEVLRSGELRLCRVRAATSEPSPALISYERSGGGPAAAMLGDGLECTPATASSDDVFRWRRDSRWSARFVAVDCRARFERPLARVALALTADLPRAREAVVFRAVLRSSSGKRYRHHGVIELDGSDRVVIDLAGSEISEVAFRLVPAYLPYLNLRDLSLRE